MSFPCRLRPTRARQRFRASWRQAGGVLLGGLGGLCGACSGPAPAPAPCGAPGPAFEVSLSAPGPELPADLAVTASYGAGEETYRLSNPTEPGEVLFCQERGAVDRPSVGGSAETAVTLHCELWTDSAVTFRVASQLYEPLERELAPVLDRCGVVTTQVELELTWPSEEED